MQKRTLRTAPLLLTGFTLQGAAALVWMAAQTLRGTATLASALALVLFSCLSAVAALLAWRSPHFRAAWLDFDLHPSLKTLYLIAGLCAACTGWALLTLGSSVTFDPYRTYLRQIQPASTVFCLFGLETALWMVLVLLERIPISDRQSARSVLLHTLPAWLVLSGMAGLASFHQLAARGDVYGSWGKPAVPLLEWQIALAWAWMTLLLFVQLPRRWARFEFWVVWLAAAGLWLSQPVQPAFFATPPRAPNYEIYPFSDGLTYAQYAQSLLVGNGMLGHDIPARPLYIAFLAGLHALVGQDYPRVIMLQTLLLAFFPALLYLLGKELAGPPLGGAVALVAILRDVTSNLVAPFTNNLTTSKLYFSELPTALLLSLFALWMVRWIKRPERPGLYPLMAGGALGLSMLIRTQSFIVLPAALLLALLAQPHQWKAWLTRSALLGLGLALSVTPWLWRNHQVSGGLVFDNPDSQISVMAQRYTNRTFANAILRNPGETDSQLSARLTKMIVEGIAAQPRAALTAVTSHFINNETDNLLLIPARNELPAWGELFQPTQAFWEVWSGVATPFQAGQLAINLILIGLGIGLCWQRAGWAGLMPLGMNLSYNLWTALFRSSGERFLVPVDWSAYLYYSAGLLALTAGLLSLLRSRAIFPETSPVNNPQITPTTPFIHYALSGVLILALGSFLPLSEHLYPQLYPPVSQPDLIARLASSATFQSSGLDASRIAEKGGTVLYGRAIYPRYYAANEVEPRTNKLGYGNMTQARLVFFLVGPTHVRVIMDQLASPAFFPHAADVILVGQNLDGYFKPALVLVSQGGRQALLIDPAAWQQYTRP